MKRGRNPKSSKRGVTTSEQITKCVIRGEGIQERKEKKEGRKMDSIPAYGKGEGILFTMAYWKGNIWDWEKLKRGGGGQKTGGFDFVAVRKERSPGRTEKKRGEEAAISAFTTIKKRQISLFHLQGKPREMPKEGKTQIQVDLLSRNPIVWEEDA